MAQGTSSPAPWWWLTAIRRATDRRRRTRPASPFRMDAGSSPDPRIPTHLPSRARASARRVDPDKELTKSSEIDAPAVGYRSQIGSGFSRTVKGARCIRSDGFSLRVPCFSWRHWPSRLRVIGRLRRRRRHRRRRHRPSIFPPRPSKTSCSPSWIHRPTSCGFRSRRFRAPRVRSRRRRTPTRNGPRCGTVRLR